jgi:hypothetical protein
MENPSAPAPPVLADNSGENMFSSRNNIIIILLLLLFFSFLGINFLIISGNALKTLAEIFGPVVLKVAAMLGYSTGHFVNTTADLSTDAAKLGLDIAEGTANSIGNLMKNASKGGMDEADRVNLEKALTSPHCPTQPPPPVEPDKSSNVIQNPIAAKKGGWCLVGDDEGVRGCIRVEEHDKCMSGQIFPSKEVCMNPLDNA